VKTEVQLGVEQSLLLALIDSRSNAQKRVDVPSLLRDVNWPKFLHITSEDLYPYVAFALEPYRSSLDALPELERLSNARRLTAAHNLLKRHELERVLAALQERCIPALALKGAVLAFTAYPDPSCRPMADLDLLVPPSKREKALQVLQTLGCEGLESEFIDLPNHAPWRLHPNQEFVLPLRIPASRVSLEVHSQLECSEPFFPMTINGFWSRSIVVNLQGLRLETLCAEDSLFHLCLHQSHHHRFEKGLLPLIDLKLLLESRPDWNWEGILERSLQSGCATWMYLTLEVARDLVGAPVPDSFFEALPRPRDPGIRSLLKERIWSVQSARPQIPRFLCWLLADRSWRSRARMIFIPILRVIRKEKPKSATSSLARLYQAVIGTLKTRIPRYAFAWKRGHLKLHIIRQDVALLRASNTLFQLIEDEAKCAVTLNPVNHGHCKTSQQKVPGA